MENHLYHYKISYVSNYDGDSIKCQVDHGFGIFSNQTLRLAGMDTYEIRGGTEATKKLAYEAKSFVKEVLEGNEIIIKTDKDKQGSFYRYLATIFYKRDDEWINLNKELSQRGLTTGKYE